jgi:sugar O-acyltransferase (sialic acid O-acetyltransferase NeuD family)
MPKFLGNHHPAGPAQDRLVVIGAGGHAKVVVATLQAAGLEISEIVDDNPELWGKRLFGIPVTGPVSSLVHGASNAKECRGIIAVGDNEVRRRLARTRNLDWITVVHPSATVHDSVVLGRGSIVCAGAVIQPDAVIGAHVIVNTSASIDHDARIGDFSHIAPAACLAGGAAIGDRVLISMGARILPGIAVGQDAVVGAGAVVVRDVRPGSLAIGVPARATPHPVLEAA